MNFANLKTSKPLQRLHGLLLESYPNWLTTKQIERVTKICNVSTRISELRRQGIRTDCHLQRITKQAKIFIYRLKQ